jgi:ATP-dependent Lon protease
MSLVTGIPVYNNLAMTGEITLRGKVLPVGGIREKVIAAHRYGIGTILLPFENRREFMEYVSDDIRGQLTVHFVKDMDEVLQRSLTREITIPRPRDRGKGLANPELQ